VAAAYSGPRHGRLSVRYAVLLRGVNVGTNQLAMGELCDRLAAEGFSGVRTHGRSGNVILETTSRAPALERELGGLLGVGVVVRSANELSAVVARDPLGKAADYGSRHLVTFFRRAPARGLEAELAALARDGELVAVHGREVYSWHPHGQHDSRLAQRLARPHDQPATARNWNTVTKLLSLLEAD
jgi:uncharacterized protein (DUF1697 family)